MAITGKNKRKHVEVLDTVHGQVLSADSCEECDFTMWLCEAHDLSIINDFTYQPCSFVLADGIDYADVSGKKKCLFREHVYSPDFVLTIDPALWPDLSKEFKIRQNQLSSSQCSVWVDTKGCFSVNERSFSTDRKWVWQKYGIYICKIVPKMFCRKFGCAAKAFYTRKTGKSRKMYAGCKSIKEAFQSSLSK